MSKDGVVLKKEVLERVAAVLTEYYGKRIPYVLIAQVSEFAAVGTNLHDPEAVELLDFAHRKVHEQ